MKTLNDEVGKFSSQEVINDIDRVLDGINSLDVRYDEYKRFYRKIGNNVLYRSFTMIHHYLYTSSKNLDYIRSRYDTDMFKMSLTDFVSILKESQEILMNALIILEGVNSSGLCNMPLYCHIPRLRECINICTMILADIY